MIPSVAISRSTGLANRRGRSCRSTSASRFHLVQVDRSADTTRSAVRATGSTLTPAGSVKVGRRPTALGTSRCAACGPSTPAARCDHPVSWSPRVFGSFLPSRVARVACCAWPSWTGLEGEWPRGAVVAFQLHVGGFDVDPPLGEMSHQPAGDADYLARTTRLPDSPARDRGAKRTPSRRATAPSSRVLLYRSTRPPRPRRAPGRPTTATAACA